MTSKIKVLNFIREYMKVKNYQEYSGLFCEQLKQFKTILFFNT
jgi:hypothetical protein